jgi:hypothetical protein
MIDKARISTIHRRYHFLVALFISHDGTPRREGDRTSVFVKGEGTSKRFGGKGEFSVERLLPRNS